MDFSAEFWTARGGTHIAAELVSLRFSWFHGSMQSSYYFHLHRGHDAIPQALFEPNLEPFQFHTHALVVPLCAAGRLWSNTIEANLEKLLMRRSTRAA